MNVTAHMLVSVVLAGLRIAGVHHPAYQAAAHLYVGGLVAAWWIYYRKRDARRASVYGWLAVALSVVEVVCFLWFRA